MSVAEVAWTVFMGSDIWSRLSGDELSMARFERGRPTPWERPETYLDCERQIAVYAERKN